MPPALGELGCIVNLAGNPRLQFGPDVPALEREALLDLYKATHGRNWGIRTNWGTVEPVAKWYKVRAWLCCSELLQVALVCVLSINLINPDSP